MGAGSIISLIQQGKISDFSEIPEMVVTTISNVFIFQEAKKVLKIYRRDNEYWNTSFSDISKGESRIQFIREDFSANKAVSPLVYLELKKATVVDGMVNLSPPEDGDDELVILMQYINAKESFNDSLFRGDIPQQEFASIGSQFGNIKKNLSISEERPSDNWFELMTQRVTDLKIWMEHLSQYIPSEVTNQCIEVVTKYTETNKERFRSIQGNDLAYTIDAHGENALFDDGKLEFIDILLPNARWRWTPKEYDIYRIGVDILILSGEENLKHYIDGAKKEYAEFEEKDENFYLLYCAALMVCILSTLIQSKPEKELLMRKYYQGFISLLQAQKRMFTLPEPVQ